MDLIKTRVQLQVSSGFIQTARQVISESGARGLYRGLLPNILGVMPEKAVKLGVNDYLRDVITPDRREETGAAQALGRATTGLVQTTITNPYEAIKIHMQAHDGGRGASVMSIARRLGVRGLYNGFVVCNVRDVPYNVIFFPTYIFTKRCLTDETGTVSQLAIITSGVLAGMIGAVFCTPADVVKTRLQSPGSNYASIADCARQTYADGGLRQFFRGAVARASISGPLYGVALLCFELQKKYFRTRYLDRSVPLHA